MSGQRLLFPGLTVEEVADGWLVDLPSLTSDQVLEAVGRRHPMDGYNGMPGRWVFVREVQASTGSYGDVQRFDAVAVGLVPSNKYARVVYEVKVSRSDWLRELRPPKRIPTHELYRSLYANREPDAQRAKWAAALEVSTEFWYAVAPRCILPEELPPEAGLVEIRLFGPSREPRAKVVKQAPVRVTPNPDAGFWAAVLRRAALRRPNVSADPR